MKKIYFIPTLFLTFAISSFTVNASPTAVTDFSIRLFQQNIYSEENALISPLSVLYALSMTANGAKDNTLSQMEEILGLDLETWNAYLSTYKNSLSPDSIHLANSIWFDEKDNFTVNENFLQKNSDYYDAEIYAETFDDSTLSKINSWIDKETDDMIDNILEKLPEDAVMYLINALAFDEKWESPYEKSQIHEGIFTSANGKEQTADFMYSEEQQYLESENAAGFLKYYEDQTYAFATILPNEDIELEDYIASLTGDSLHEMISSVQDTTVETVTPQFTASYEVQLNEILKTLGMTDAFDSALADFSGLGTSDNGNIYIGQILHKTYLSLDAQGTEASAATTVEVIEECALEIEDLPKYVCLDRPFLYMIIDCSEGIPLFLGTVTSLA